MRSRECRGCNREVQVGNRDLEVCGRSCAVAGAYFNSPESTSPLANATAPIQVAKGILDFATWRIPMATCNLI